MWGLVAVWAGCGDYFRPVAFPNTPTPPNTAAAHFVYFFSQNGGNNPGSGTRIDVAGDTNVANTKLGINPVHAALLPNGDEIYVVNQLEDTLSFYPPSVVTGISTITLPPGSRPVFVAGDNNTVYVANAGTNSVSVIPTANNVVTNVIPVGAGPVALAETPDHSKVYAVNQTAGTVTSINTLDSTVNSTTATGATPVWSAMRSDGQRLYVLNSGGGTVSAINTANDTVLGNASVGAGANFILYDESRTRLYVTNPVANTLSILSASVDPPAVLAVVPMPASPMVVAALPNASKVYVASVQAGSNVISQVSVLNAGNNTVTSTIALNTVPAVAACAAARFRLFTVASADSTRIYVAGCDAGGTAIIRTVPGTFANSEPADTVVVDLPAPVSAGTSVNGSQPPPQNPVFMLAGP